MGSPRLFQYEVIQAMQAMTVSLDELDPGVQKVQLDIGDGKISMNEGRNPPSVSKNNELPQHGKMQ